MRDPFADLITDLRDRAERYREDGATVDGAKVCHRLASELEVYWRTYWQAPLTLQQAADETGRPYSTLQKHVADGRISNVGHKGSPRVRRCDLYAH